MSQPPGGEPGEGPQPHSGGLQHGAAAGGFLDLPSPYRRDGKPIIDELSRKLTLEERREHMKTEWEGMGFGGSVWWRQSPQTSRWSKWRTRYDGEGSK
jgi:hypothetical protein